LNKEEEKIKIEKTLQCLTSYEGFENYSRIYLLSRLASTKRQFPQRRQFIIPHVCSSSSSVSKYIFSISLIVVRNNRLVIASYDGIM
jgi:hypothetical protein